MNCYNHIMVYTSIPGLNKNIINLRINVIAMYLKEMKNVTTVPPIK